MRFLASIALVLLLAVGASAESMEFPGFRLDSPVPFGAVQDFGGDVYFAVFPDTNDTNKVTLELIVIHTSHDSVAAIQDSGASARQVAVSTFMGKDEKPEQINKALCMGSTEAHLVYTSYTPRPNKTHVFQHLLDNGGLVTVALRDYGGNEPKVVGEVLRAISNTFVALF